MRHRRTMNQKSALLTCKFLVQDTGLVRIIERFKSLKYDSNDCLVIFLASIHERLR